MTSPVQEVQTPAPRRLDVALEPAELRDVEAALLGILADGHTLGGAVGSGPAADVPGRPVVQLPGRSVPVGTVLALRDPEHSLAAELDVSESDGTGVRGALRPGRLRESGLRADLALGATDRGRGGGIVVLARPPVHEDDATLRALLAAAGELVVVVPDDPAGPVPAAVLLEAAAAWLAETGAGPRAELRIAPLAGRSPGDDARLRGRLLEWLAATQAAVLAPGDGTRAAIVWEGAERTLREGRVPPSGLDPGVAQVLNRWRPPRLVRGVCVMFTGLSGSGKSTLARDLADWLRSSTSRTVTVLDGDRVRRLLSAGLGFDRAGREMNVRRIGFVAAEIVRHGGVAVCSPIAPFAQTRSEVRAMVEEVGDLVLVHVDTPLAECERRDVKGLYAQARRGELPDFTGISSPYEEPADADLRVDTSVLGRAEALAAVTDLLVAGGWVEEIR